MIGAIAAGVLLALAPAASAQLVPDLPGDIGGVDLPGDIGGGGTGGSGSDGGGEGDGGLISDPVGEIGDILDPDDGGSGSSTEDPIKKIGGVVEETLSSPEKEADEIADDPGGYVGGVIGTTETAPKNRTRDGKLAGKKKGSRASERSAEPVGGDLFGDRNPIFRPGSVITSDNEAAKNVRLVATSVADSPDEGFVDELIHQIGRVAAEAVEQAAFPLILALLVGAFLLVQNRIDRRDPKLALAPIDSDHEQLTFS